MPVLRTLLHNIFRAIEQRNFSASMGWRPSGALPGGFKAARSGLGGTGAASVATVLKCTWFSAIALIQQSTRSPVVPPSCPRIEPVPAILHSEMRETH